MHAAAVPVEAADGAPQGGFNRLGPGRGPWRLENDQASEAADGALQGGFNRLRAWRRRVRVGAGLLLAGERPIERPDAGLDRGPVKPVGGGKLKKDDEAAGRG